MSVAAATAWYPPAGRLRGTSHGSDAGEAAAAAVGLAVAVAAAAPRLESVGGPLLSSWRSSRSNAAASAPEGGREGGEGGGGVRSLRIMWSGAMETVGRAAPSLGSPSATRTPR